MPTKKISAWPFCLDSDHKPNKNGLEPGVYEHTCPKCGCIQQFTIRPKSVKEREIGDPWPKHVPLYPEPWPTPWQPQRPYYPPAYPGTFPTNPFVYCSVGLL